MSKIFLVPAIELAIIIFIIISIISVSSFFLGKRYALKNLRKKDVKQ